MADLRCNDGDVNGYGCLSSQFVDSLVLTPQNPSSQWFGRIARFHYTLTLATGQVVQDSVIKAAIDNGDIQSCTLLNVAYTVDPQDPRIAYAEGALDITTAPGCAIPSSTPGNPHRIRHTLTQVWRLTETKILP